MGTSVKESGLQGVTDPDFIVAELQCLELAFLVFLHTQVYIIMDATDTEKSCTTDHSNKVLVCQ